MARFSVCGGDDGEGPSNHHSRKRQRLPSIDEDEEPAECSDAGSSGEEEETQNHEIRIPSEDRESTSDDNSDRKVVIEEEEERRFGNSVNSQSSSSSSKDSSLSLTLLDPDVLDCPICFEPLKIPIFQCDNGHLACSSCCTKVRNRCPSCLLPIGYIRCRAMEKVIEASRVSCPNAKYGCKEIFSYGNRSSHEKLCVFTPCSCPILNCNYTGYYKDLNNHVRVNHKGDDLIPFVWDTPLIINLDLSDMTIILQEENDGEVIVVQVFIALHAAFVSVRCIAPSAPGVSRFSCSLVNINVDSLLKQGFVVKNIQKVTRSVQPEDGFMLIPSYMVSGNENLDLRIRISRGRVLHT